MSRGSAARQSFVDAYGYPPAGVWAAPGRVNLIGEHTDYNDGFVLPFALPLRVLCAAQLRADGVARVRSQQLPGEEVTVRLADLRPGTVTGWAAYPLGVVWAIAAAGHAIGGMDLFIDGDVPLGSGLSSSAAVECAVASAVNGLGALHLDLSTLAGVARRAENDFVGAPTGVMDQMVSMHGRLGHVLLLDARTLEIEHVPFDLSAHDLALLVIDTRSTHDLVGGEYAARRHACERAARGLGVQALRDVSVDQLVGPAFERLAADEQRCARHVVTENARVLAVAATLRRGVDPRQAGHLLTASHVSLRDDFQVTGPELDVAVDAALAAGAHGARMTGAGFGGCVIALVDGASTDAVAGAVSAAFARKGFSAPRFFPARPSAGAHQLRRGLDFERAGS